VASLSQGRTAAAQCGLFTYKSVPVIFEPPCTICMLVLLCRPGMYIIIKMRGTNVKIIIVLQNTSSKLWN